MNAIWWIFIILWWWTNKIWEIYPTHYFFYCTQCEFSSNCPLRHSPSKHSHFQDDLIEISRKPVYGHPWETKLKIKKNEINCHIKTERLAEIKENFYVYGKQSQWVRIHQSLLFQPQSVLSHTQSDNNSQRWRWSNKQLKSSGSIVADQL